MTAPAPDPTDRFAVARAVADAVLYEGYVLYPYRASARKNQLRWQFGVLVPPAFSAVDGSERSAVRTECLLAPGTSPRLTVRMRCLQVQHRSVEVVGDPNRLPAPVVPWDEAVEQVVDLPVQALSPLVTASRVEQFRFSPADESELVPDPEGDVIAHIVRRREPVNGRVVVDIAPADDFSGLLKVTVTVENQTDPVVVNGGGRDAMLRRSLVAVHTMLAVDDGCFVSLLDPPAHAGVAVRRCDNDGAFPVLVGPDDDVVLSSPIVLYDHPAVAAESPGDLYDSTEIDEILALRILTLTDEEKVEARATDARAAAIIDRVDAMAPETWERLHGSVRSISPVPPVKLPIQAIADMPWWDPGVDASVDPDTDSVRVGDVDVAKGTRVRLQPNRRADAQDLFLAGQEAVVTAVFHDVDGGDHVAVVLADDPNADLAEAQGRFLYFAPDEVHPIDSDDREETT